MGAALATAAASAKMAKDVGKRMLLGSAFGAVWCLGSRWCGSWSCSKKPVSDGFS